MILEKRSQNSQKKAYVRDSILIKLHSQGCKKETLTQVFCCELSQISKNTFFTEHIRTTASAFSFSEEATGGVLWKNVFLKISQNSQENTLGLQNFQKHLFTEHHRKTASDFSFSEAATRGVLWKIVVLKISQNSQENTFICEIFKSNLFTEHLWTTASGFFVQRY